MRAAALALALLAAGCAAVRSPRHEDVTTALAPLPIGPYSQAIRAGDTLWLAGQIGVNPRTGELARGGAAAETRQALTNLGAVLESAGFTRHDVVQAQVYLADLADFAAMNEVYGEFFPLRPPARTTVGVAALPRDARVEIALVAVRRR